MHSLATRLEPIQLEKNHRDKQLEITIIPDGYT